MILSRLQCHMGYRGASCPYMGLNMATPAASDIMEEGPCQVAKATQQFMTSEA